VDHRASERDLELLEFLAEHRLALPAHVAVLLETSNAAATTRLKRLAGAGLVKGHAGFQRFYQITKGGLGMIGSSLSSPGTNLREYEHDVGVAWLWLAAHRGTFGPVEEIISDRRLRSHDGFRDPQTEPLAVRLGGFGPRGNEQLHYPDLVLRTMDGRRVALELELTPKSRTRLEKILAGYGADPRYDGVVYLVGRPLLARSVQSTARRLGISDLVHVQRVRSTASTSASAAIARTAGRTHATDAVR